MIIKLKFFLNKNVIFFNLLPIAVFDEFNCVGMLRSIFLACCFSSIRMSYFAGGVGGSR
jgi:hypothetical protein